MKDVKFKKGDKCYLQRKQVEVLSVRYVLTDGKWDVLYRLSDHPVEVRQHLLSKVEKGFKKKIVTPTQGDQQKELEDIQKFLEPTAEEKQLHTDYEALTGETVPEGMSSEEIRETIQEIIEERNQSEQSSDKDEKGK